MTFRETLDKHLKAIQDRDLKALAETLPVRDTVLITSDGKLVRSVAEFLEMHRGWFAMPTWQLGVTPAHVCETPDLGVAVLHLDYRETPSDRPPVHQTSYLTLIFQRLGGRWVMVHDQNTPIKAAQA
jgi:uncharacterized protein (TIGR02246 family)